MGIALMLATGMQNTAQEKKDVLVEEFTSESNISDSDIRTLRDKVIQALIKTGRVNVMDITRDDASGGDYTILKGYIQSPAVNTETLKGEKKGDTYAMSNSSLNYIITMISPESANQGTSFLFKSRGTGY